jgi:hypothetical protein
MGHYDYYHPGHNPWAPAPIWPPIDPYIGRPPHSYWPPVDPYMCRRSYPGTPPFVPGPHPYYDRRPPVPFYGYEDFNFQYRDYDGGFRFGYRSGPGYEGYNFGFDFDGGSFDFGIIEPRFPNFYDFGW